MSLKHFYAHNKVIRLLFFFVSSWSLTTGISLFILHSIKLGAAALLLTLAKDKPGKICITAVAYLSLCCFLTMPSRHGWNSSFTVILHNP